MKRKHLTAFWHKYQVLFYRLLVIILLITIPFYGRISWTIKNKLTPENVNIAQIYNSPDAKPTASDIEIGKDEDLAFLDETLKKIFPEGWENLSQEEKSIEIARFVTTYLKLEGNSGSATKILKEGHAICGGMSHVFRILNRRTGVPARYIGIFYAPSQGSHNLTEIYYDNIWHLFDPTFGVFVYSNQNYDKKGYILSMSEIRQNSQAGFLQQLVEKPWTGEYLQDLKQYGVQSIKDNYLSERNFSTDGFDKYWRNEITKSFPVAYGANSWISMPIDINLENKNYETIGQIDKKYDNNTYATRFKGTNYLGKAGNVPGIYNTWMINNPNLTKVRIRYWTSKKNVSLNIIDLRATQLIRTERTKDYYEFVLSMNDNPAIFMVMPNQGDKFLVDAIEVFKE